MAVTFTEDRRDGAEHESSRDHYLDKHANDLDRIKLAGIRKRQQPGEMQRDYAAKAQLVVDALAEVPGLEINFRHDEFDYLIPSAVMRFGPRWQGLSREQIAEAMQQGDPPIYLFQLGEPDELAVDPLNLTDEEVETVIGRLREVLLR